MSGDGRRTEGFDWSVLSHDGPAAPKSKVKRGVFYSSYEVKFLLPGEAV